MYIYTPMPDFSFLFGDVLRNCNRTLPKHK